MVKKGLILIATFIIISVLVVVVGVFLYLAFFQLKSIGIDVLSEKAFWIAEGGLEQAIYKIKNDPDYRKNPKRIEGNLGEGSFYVEVIKENNIYTLTSTGEVKNLKRTLRESLSVEEGASSVFYYAQFSESDIDFKNSQGVINGNIGAKGNIKNDEEIEINGSKEENLNINIPSVDLSSYLAIADEVVEGDKVFEEGKYQGIWYVKGKVNIKDNVIINGSIIATEDIIFNQSENIKIVPNNNYPALISAEDIHARNLDNSTISGLIYAEGKVNFKNIENVIFNSSIIAKKDIKITKGKDFQINYDEKIVSQPPPYFYGENSVKITLQKDWEEIKK
jgi:hypothetical protein